MNENVNINLHSARDRYSYYIEMVSDPGTMFELTRYGATVGYIETPNMQKTLGYSSIINGYEESTIDNYKMKSGDVNIWQADDFVHACLEDVSTRYPETVELFATDEDMKNNTQSSSYSVHRGKSMLIDNYKT